MNKLFYILVYLTFLTTPIESVAIAENFSIFKLVSILIFIVSFFTLFNKNKSISIREPFLILFLIYTILTILSTVWSIEPDVTFDSSLKTILPSFFVTLILYNSLQDRVHVERALKAYIIGCGIASSIALYLFITGYSFEDQDGRLTVLGQDQNELSFLLSFGIVSIIYLIKYSKTRDPGKKLLIILALLYAFIILTTGSRMGFLVLLTIIMILILENIKGGRIVFLVPIILIFGILVFNYLPQPIFERLFETKDQIKSFDMSNRGTIWKMGWSAFKYENAYIVGIGFNTFSNLIANYYYYGAASHNTYLSTFIELGFLGISIFFSMIFYLLNKVYFLYKKYSILFFLFIFPLLMAMFVLTTSTRRWLYLIGVLIIKLWDLSKEEVATK